MISRLITLVTVLLTSASFAQEAVPQADAMKAAALFYAASADISDAAITIDPDIKNPFAMKGNGGIGFMVIPETKLAKELEHAREGITPVAQILMKGLLPVLGGSTVTTDKMRTISVENEGSATLVPILFVGMRADASGTKELVIYSQDKSELAALPLKAYEQEQKLPIEFRIEKSGERSAEVTLSIVGKYQANFGLTSEN